MKEAERRSWFHENPIRRGDALKKPHHKPDTRDVYALGDGRGRAKIGVSNDAYKRKRNLQTGSADELNILHVEKTAYDLGTKVERRARAILTDAGKEKTREWIRDCSADEARDAIRTAHDIERGRNRKP